MGLFKVLEKFAYVPAQEKAAAAEGFFGRGVPSLACVGKDDLGKDRVPEECSAYSSEFATWVGVDGVDELLACCLVAHSPLDEGSPGDKLQNRDARV